MRQALLVGCLLLLAGAARASEISPEAATLSYFEALQREDMSAALRFVHPEDQARFQRMLLPVFEAEADAGQSELRAAMFGPYSTIEDVQSVEPEVFMSRFLDVVMAEANAAGGIQFDSVEVLGSVPEGDLVHVLTRTKVGVGELALSGVEVVSWRRYENGWRTVLSGEMEGMARHLRSRFGR